jgi:hypothetical protein
LFPFLIALVIDLLEIIESYNTLFYRPLAGMIELLIAVLLVAALGYAVYKVYPSLMVKEPFIVYKANDPEHRQILPPNAGLGSLEPTLLPLDKQNADMRGPYAYVACDEKKIKGIYPLSTVLESQDDCLTGFNN